MCVEALWFQCFQRHCTTADIYWSLYYVDLTFESGFKPCSVFRDLDGPGPMALLFPTETGKDGSQTTLVAIKIAYTQITGVCRGVRSGGWWYWAMWTQNWDPMSDRLHVIWISWHSALQHPCLTVLTFFFLLHRCWFLEWCWMPLFAPLCVCSGLSGPSWWLPYVLRDCSQSSHQPAAVFPWVRHPFGLPSTAYA